MLRGIENAKENVNSGRHLNDRHAIMMVVEVVLVVDIIVVVVVMVVVVIVAMLVSVSLNMGRTTVPGGSLRGDGIPQL
jgi:hypothetical protein